MNTEIFAQWNDIVGLDIRYTRCDIFHHYPIFNEVNRQLETLPDQRNQINDTVRILLQERVLSK